MVIAAGPAVNLVLAFLLLFVFFWAIGPQDVGAAGSARSSAAIRRPGS